MSVRGGTAIVEARAPVGLDLINLYIAGSQKNLIQGVTLGQCSRSGVGVARGPLKHLYCY